MKIEAIAGDSSGVQSATVWADSEGSHVVITIDPSNDVRADAMLTPDQALELSRGLAEAANRARITPEE